MKNVCIHIKIMSTESEKVLICREDSARLVL